MRRLVLIALAAVVTGGTLFALTGDTGSDPAVLATVGERTVSESAFRRAYGDYLLSTGLPDSPSNRLRFLDGQLAREVVIQEGLRARIDTSQALIDRLNRIEEKLLLEAHAFRTLYDTIRVTEGEMADLFVRMNTQVTARHLFAETKLEAERLLARLETGESFDVLAAETFLDPHLRDSGGSVGTFSFDEMDAAFEEAAFGLRPGETSGPVRTAQGWSIIRVDDRFTKPLLTEDEFNRRRDKIRGYVTERRRIGARKAFSEEVASELDPEYGAGFDLVLGYVDGTGPGEAGERDDGVPPDEARLPSFGPRADEGEASVMVRFGPSRKRVAWTVSDFRQRAAGTTLEQRAAVRDRTSLEQFALGLLIRDETLARARGMGLQRTNAFQEAYAEAADDARYESAFRRLAASVSVATDSIRAHYERHQDEFVEPARRRIHEIVTGSRSDAMAVLAALEAESFETVAARSIRPGAAERGGDLGMVARPQLGAIGDILFAADDGALLGPFEASGRFHVYRVGPQTEARRATLAEAVPEIHRRLIDSHVMTFMRARVDSVMARSAPSVDTLRLYSLPLTSGQP